MPVDYGYAAAVATVDELHRDGLRIEYTVTNTATLDPLTVNWRGTIGEIVAKDCGIVGEFDRYGVYWGTDWIRLAEEGEFKDELKDQEISKTDFEKLIVGK